LARYLIFALFPFFAFSQQLSYSQNNPPKQHQFDANIQYNVPILMNADLLIGQVNSSQIPALLEQTGNPAVTDSSVKEVVVHFLNKEKIGMRLGIGIGIKNCFNLSVQWTYLRGGNSTQKTFGATDPTAGLIITNLQILNTNYGNTVRGNSAEYKTDQNLYFNIGDLLVQTAAINAFQKIRFQPFGGLRYLSFKRSINDALFDLGADTFALAYARIRMHAIGALLGTDIKYIFSNYFHFFGSALYALLAGHQSLFATNQSNMGPSSIAQTFDEKFEIALNGQYEFRFGIGFDYAFKRALIALRLAYELSSFLQEESNLVQTTISASSRQLLRTVDVVKHRAFVVGLTVGF
jgi:hypothetical protein